MHGTEITNKLIVRKAAAGPSINNLLAPVRKLSDSEKNFLASRTDADAERPKTKEAETEIQIDGRIVLVSRIISPRETVSVAYTEDFEYLAGGYADGIIRMYRSDNSEPSHKLVDPEVTRSPVTCIKHRPTSKSYPISNTLTCTYTNGCVKCWNYNFNQCVYTIREKRQTYGLTYHPRLPKFVTYGDDMNIYMYDEETRTQERTLTKSDNPNAHDGHTSRIYAACFNPRSNHEVCTGGWDNVVQFWDLRQPHAIRHIGGVHICGEGIDINQKGTELITCAFQKDKSIQHWDYPSGKLIKNVEPDIHQSKLYCGKYVGKDFFVCGGTDPNILRFFDIGMGFTKCLVQDLPTAVYGLDLGPPPKINPANRNAPIQKNELTGVPKIAVAAGKGLFQFEPK
ncbi:unnamed protein product [Brassicogethes aeneus]|uniref:Uncharacterized protein n=1 Tax=Brassicogethes aeneus TaxID=1431903 RepID=A0A9P0B6N9_BRAAE|nr:unnamed protein product [Brassicogethes aeneus]